MENHRIVRRKDTTKGPPLRILSLDGGGVRGYSMLIIVQELMHRTFVETEGRAPKRHEIPKPAEHFDLIMGTGTGGLIAIMLGRLRLDLETCKEVYVRMTRKVFETDKTIAGIPYRSTLFKASKLEEAIRECVREHTVLQREGNDGAEPPARAGLDGRPRRHVSNASVASFSARGPSRQPTMPWMGAHDGNPDALLYDDRENRTKTCVTAIYRGTPLGGQPALLRSYDSRKEPPPEFDCTIWQAGRATSATGLAFKPIQVGQSVFVDEGAGQYNPSVFALDEACANEWPSRDVGVFVSIGTGKRPCGPGFDQNSHLWYEGFMGEFAEARRRLIAKIEGCEQTHQYLVREGLRKRGVNPEHYYRFNVEMGVGEFGMNEWNRLADISTGTRRYLAKPQVQHMNISAAAKLAKIMRAKARFEHERTADDDKPVLAELPDAFANAAELPADVPLFPARAPPPRSSYESGHHETLEVPGSSPGAPPSPSSRASHEHPTRPGPRSPRSPPPSHAGRASYRASTAAGADLIAITSGDEQPLSPMQSPPRAEPPPVPPKTPVSDRSSDGWQGGRSRLSMPPPAVNMSRKPQYQGR